MKNKIPTLWGFAIIIIISFTIVFLAFNYFSLFKQNDRHNFNQEVPKKDINAIEQPEIPVTEQMSLEEAVKTGIYNELRYKNTSVNNIILENVNGNYAYGRFDHQSGGGNHKNNIWFALKESNVWKVVHISYVGYFGYCPLFQNLNFPQDMIPDCWDEENKILIETKNPSAFYTNGLKKEDKSLLLSAFLKYLKDNDQERYEEFYSQTTLFVRVNANTQNHVRGTILIGGIENISAPSFYALREGRGWKIVHYGQDYPWCKDTESYDFPSEILKDCLK